MFRSFCLVLAIDCLACWPLLHGQSAEPPLAPGGSPPPAPVTVAPPSSLVPGQPQLAVPGQNEGTLSPVDPPAPQVLLRVRVPARVAPGAELTYTITVENPTLVPAHRVKVRNTLPSSAKFARAVPQAENEGGDLVWNLGTMAPNSRKTISMTLIADGTGDIDNTAKVSYEHGETTKTKVASSMQITKRGPAQAQVLDTWTYILDIQNTGSTPLVNLQVTDILPEGLDFLTSQPSTKGENPLTWTIEKLEPLQAKRIEYQVAAKKAGTYETKASVSIAGGLKREASWKTVVSEPKLDLVLSGPESRAVGRPATYHITVTNDGKTTARNVRLSTKLPQGTTFLAASSGGREAQGEVRWDLGILQPGQRRAVNLVMRANSPLRLIQRVELVADRLGHGLQAEKTTTFSGKDLVLLELDKTIDPIEVGEPATYTLRLINRGTTPVNNSGITISVPDTLTQVEARGPTQGTKNGNTVTFGAVPRLEPGREIVYSIQAIGARPGTGKLTAELVNGGGADAPPPTKLQETIQVLQQQSAATAPR